MILNTEKYSKNITVHQQFTPSSSRRHLNYFINHKPRNFSASNEILKKSKELSTIHRQLIYAKPARIKSRDIIYDKIIDAYDISSRDSDSQILQPKIDIITDIKNNDFDKEKKLKHELDKEKFLKSTTKNNTQKCQAKKHCEEIKISPRKYKNRSMYSSSTRNVGKKLAEIRNFDSFIREKVNRISSRKYDLSSIQINSHFSIKNS